MSYLTNRFKYGAYLKNEDGIKKFAEMAMGRLIERTTRKSAAYREMNENLLVEKANLRMRGDLIFEAPMVAIAEFFTTRKKVVWDGFIVGAIILGEIALLLNYFPRETFVPGESSFIRVLQWFVAIVLAVVLTGGAVVIAERLIESLLPVRRYKQGEPLQQLASLPVTVLWAVLLIGIEIAIIGITVAARDTRADALAPILHFGFIILAVVLPIVAGAFRWDMMHYLDAYKSTQQYRRIETRLSQIDSILRQNEEYESIYYKLKSTDYWDLLNEFRTSKENYNARHDIHEDLSTHFARNNDAFQAEAMKRYGSDVRDVATMSLRKLESATEKLGAGKLGPKSAVGVTGASPTIAQNPPVANTVGDGEITESLIAPRPD